MLTPDTSIRDAANKMIARDFQELGCLFLRIMDFHLQKFCLALRFIMSKGIDSLVVILKRQNWITDLQILHRRCGGL